MCLAVPGRIAEVLLEADVRMGLVVFGGVTRRVCLEHVLDAMRAHPLGVDAAFLGELVAEHPGTVVLRSRLGGMRIVAMLSGDQLPRIC